MTDYLPSLIISAAIYHSAGFMVSALGKSKNSEYLAGILVVAPIGWGMCIYGNGIYNMCKKWNV